MKVVMIQWNEGYSKGWTDVIPFDWLTNSKAVPDDHLVMATKGVGDQDFRLICSRFSDGKTLEIRYDGPNAEKNVARGLDYPGALRLETSGRSFVVLWQEPRSQTWEPCTFQTTVRREMLRDESADLDWRKFRLYRAAVREGQARFKKALKNRYGNCCAVTRCDIDEAIDAAHIEDFLGLPSNHTDNGILLRADLHRLFDRRLLTFSENGLPVFRRDNDRKYYGKQVAKAKPLESAQLTRIKRRDN